MTASTLLLVDDDPRQLQMLRAALGPEYHILVARSGEAAIRIANKSSPDLIMLDVQMPGLTGYQVCQTLKHSSETAEIPVIFVSVEQSPSSKVRGLDAGAVDFVSKPFEAAEVRARVQAHLRIRALGEELQRQNHALTHELAVARKLLSSAADRVAGDLAGESRAARSLRSKLALLGSKPGAVLLEAPPGSGAEAAARWLHAHAGEVPFLHQLCRALTPGSPDDLVTGEGDEPSKVDLAKGGILFLEGLEDLPVSHSLWLTEYLEDPAALQTTRIVASVSTTMTCRTPALIGAFPNKVRIPSLAERPNDVEFLVNHTISRLSRSIVGPDTTLDVESLDRLKRHSWPGDVRELRALIERTALTHPAPELHVPDAMLRSAGNVGHYELRNKIGEGAMGEVWRARHALLRRPAAVKLIRPSLLTDRKAAKQAIASLRKEATAMAGLRSTHTVSLWDFGLGPAGEFYYVMELLEGLDLFRMLQRHGPLDPARIIHLLKQICCSLTEAHAAGLVHRDIKPSNLFVANLGPERDVLKVLDFGIVTAMAGDVRLAGTHGYIAPELLSRSAADHRADLYSLGCVAFRLLAGRGVFSELPKSERVKAHTAQTPLPPSTYRSVPAELDALVLRLLSKDPAKRPGSAAELSELLDALPVERWSQQDARNWWTTHGFDPMVTPPLPSRV